MKTLKLLAVATAMAFAAAALADVEVRRQMDIVVGGPLADEGAIIHWIGSGDAGIDMQSMQVGESQSVVDESGRAVLITREAKGFRFDVDGKAIVVPDFVVAGMGTRGEYLTFADGSDMTADFDVEIVGDHHAMSAIAMPAFGNSGVTIISDEPLDASTQESIRAVLQSAGRDDEVTFIGGGAAADGGQINMIRKRVEITQ